jgi:malate permease and related proteins
MPLTSSLAAALGVAGHLFLSVVLPLALLVVLGWGVERRFRLDLETLIKITLHVFVPAFVFVRVTESPLEAAVAVKLALGTLGVISCMWALSTALSRWRGDPPARAASTKLAAMIYNCGNFGLPAVTLAFGKGAAEAQVFVLVTVNITTFTLGTLIATGASGQPWWQRLSVVTRQPPVWAAAVALGLRLTPWHPQACPPLWEPLHWLAEGLVGLMLLTLGIQLGKTRPPPLRADLVGLMIIRLGLGPVLGWALACALRLPPDLMRVMVLSAAAPTAVNTALLAHEFKADAAFAAAAVFYTTVFSLLSVTIVLAVLHLTT